MSNDGEKKKLTKEMVELEYICRYNYTTYLDTAPIHP